MDRVMDVRPIKTEADYDAALAEIDRLFDVTPSSPEGDRLEVLLTLVGAYEKQHWAIEAPDPVDAIKHRMEQAGYTHKDLAAVLGSASRATEILKKTRVLTVPMIWKLSREWNIPAEALVKPYAVHARRTPPKAHVRHKLRAS